MKRTSKKDLRASVALFTRRGLKSQRARLCLISEKVALFTRAWIEIVY